MAWIMKTSRQVEKSVLNLEGKDSERVKLNK